MRFSLRGESPGKSSSSHAFRIPRAQRRSTVRCVNFSNVARASTASISNSCAQLSRTSSSRKTFASMRRDAGRSERGARASQTPAESCDAQSTFSRGCVRGHSRRGRSDRTRGAGGCVLVAEFQKELQPWNARLRARSARVFYVSNGSIRCYVAGHWVPEWWQRAGGSRCSRARGETVVSRRLGNCAGGTARSDGGHAVRV